AIGLYRAWECRATSRCCERGYSNHDRGACRRYSLPPRRRPIVTDHRRARPFPTFARPAGATPTSAVAGLYDTCPVRGRRRKSIPAARRPRSLAADAPRTGHVSYSPAGERSGSTAPDYGAPSNQPGREETEHEDRRSEEHTSELQSRENLVCRLLL